MAASVTKPGGWALKSRTTQHAVGRSATAQTKYEGEGYIPMAMAGFTSKNTSVSGRNNDYNSKAAQWRQTVIERISQKHTSRQNKFDDASSDELTMNKIRIKSCRGKNEQRYIPGM